MYIHFIMYIQYTFNIMSNSLQSIISGLIYLIQIKYLTVFQLHGHLCVYLHDNRQIMRLFIGNNRNNRLFVYIASNVELNDVLMV